MREDVGQLLWVGFAGPEVPPDLRARLEAGAYGATILFKRNLVSTKVDEKEELDLDDLKWVVLMVLFNQPGSEAAYAWMETQMFLDEPEPVH